MLNRQTYNTDYSTFSYSTSVFFNRNVIFSDAHAATSHVNYFDIQKTRFIDNIDYITFF